MTTEINTNTRPLRRNPDLSWSAAGKSLCGYCAIRSSCEKADGEVSTACRDTVPTLSFQDEIGLTHLSNTVRVGRAWEQRLRIGDRVGLYNALTQKVFSFARVIHVTSGVIGAMLRDHAHANHQYLHLSPEQAPRELATWLRKNYGPRIVNPQTYLTAIYLLVEPQQAAQAAVNGRETGG